MPSSAFHKTTCILASLPYLKALYLSFGSYGHSIEMLSLLLKVKSTDGFVVELPFSHFEGQDPVMEALERKMEGKKVPFTVVRKEKEKEKTVAVDDHLDESDNEEIEELLSRRPCTFQ